jgi:hypothetical protein
LAKANAGAQDFRREFLNRETARLGQLTCEFHQNMLPKRPMTRTSASTVIIPLVILLFASGLTEGGSESLVCPARNHFLPLLAASSACPAGQVEASPPVAGYDPWTHKPYCTRSPVNGNKLCVYTNANFHHGVSIVAKPEVAAQIIDESQLTVMPQPDGFVIKYEALDIPGIGVGLFVKPGSDIKAGETIMIDHPTLILPSKFEDPFYPEQVFHLYWKAMLQLPEAARAKSRAMARSMSQPLDDIENLMATNSFYNEKAGGKQDALFTEAAVRSAYP